MHSQDLVTQTESGDPACQPTAEQLSDLTDPVTLRTREEIDEFIAEQNLNREKIEFVMSVSGYSNWDHDDYLTVMSDHVFRYTNLNTENIPMVLARLWDLAFPAGAENPGGASYQPGSVVDCDENTSEDDSNERFVLGNRDQYRTYSDLFGMNRDLIERLLGSSGCLPTLDNYRQVIEAHLRKDETICVSSLEDFSSTLWEYHEAQRARERHGKCFSEGVRSTSIDQQAQLYLEFRGDFLRAVCDPNKYLDIVKEIKDEFDKRSAPLSNELLLAIASGLSIDRFLSHILYHEDLGQVRDLVGLFGENLLQDYIRPWFEFGSDVCRKAGLEKVFERCKLLPFLTEAVVTTDRVKALLATKNLTESITSAMASLAELRSPDGSAPLVHYQAFAPIICRIVTCSTPRMVGHALRIITAMRDFLPVSYRGSESADWALVRPHHPCIAHDLVERAINDPLFVAREFHSSRPDSLGVLVRRIFPVDWISGIRGPLSPPLVIPGKAGERFASLTAEEAMGICSKFLSVSIDLF